MSHPRTGKSRSVTADNVIQHGAVAVKMLRDIAEAVNAPYLKPIAGVSLLIFDTVQTIKANKADCLRMTEQTYELICAIINLCQDSGADLSPVMIRNIGRFSETLGKILSFLQQQVRGSLLKRIVRYAENSSLLGECNEGLKHAQDVFMVQASIAMSLALTNSQKDANERHRELLMAISMQDRSLEELKSKLGRLGSSSSLEMIPASPQIFHGRESELLVVTQALLHDDPARIAILGVGGIGKSALALAALHSPDVVSKFSTRQYYISCESATSPSMLISIVAAFFGASEDEKPMKVIMRHLRHVAPSVLVLDNFETPWEPLETRAKVEEFLSLLTEIQNVDIIVTMRGAERPGNIRWTRPFLPPLRPISSDAARQIFFDISDPVDDDTQVTELLKFTDNLPLAVTLVASLASFEGCDSVFRRWKTESTAMLSDGVDKRSNLDQSILLSLTSPRMVAAPGSRELLSLLSLLPDGISEVTLERASFPLHNIPRCRVTLCRTSLAFVDRDGRLKTLAPIREYIRRAFPPTPALVHPVRNFIYDLVKPFETWEQSPVDGMFQRVAEDLGNIRSLIEHALSEQDDTGIRRTVSCVVDLSTYMFHSLSGSDSLDLLLPLEQSMDGLQDSSLQGRYFYSVMRAVTYGRDPSIDRTQLWAQKALECFAEVNDIAGQAATYIRLSWYYGLTLGSASKGLEVCYLGLELSKQVGSLHLQSRALSQLAILKRRQGLLTEALAAALEASSMARESGNLYDQIKALTRETECHIDIGKDFRKASIAVDEALALLKALGMGSNSDYHMVLMNTRAEIALQKTDYDDAMNMYRQAVDASHPTSSNSSVAAGVEKTAQVVPLNAFQLVPLLNIATVDVATWSGDGTGDEIRGRLDAIRPLLGDYSKLYPCFCDIAQGVLYFRQKQYDVAHGFFKRCLTTVHYDLGNVPELSLQCREGLSNTALAKEDKESALRYSVVFLLESLKAQAWPFIHRSLRCLGDVLLSEGDPGSAEAFFEVALEGFTYMDIHRDRADCMLRLGDIRKARDAVSATNFWMAARPLFERSSQWLDVAQCDVRLAA